MPQPVHVAVEEKGLPIVGAQRFVNAFAVEEPVIEDGNHGLLRAGHDTIDVDNGSHSCGESSTRSTLTNEMSVTAIRVLDRRQMQEADRQTIVDRGIAAAVLMERAGREVVTAMAATFLDLPSLTVAI